ncbi:tRNA1(Val) (adenine(37)-N6)-methyltransferase [Endozoicomonas sp. OPT23]|uniref:tRNA1(Val) (adenine(37)-N6)-methyltransferase n=1 Tax=Endozoicomonas sp. OPT23 TaxID=2072845 RepID=UPI001890DE99|nr:methyltransferase [Endozoicomonas sp. OPT23]
MKVTADAVLFGAIVDVESSHRILDIGAGTGLLSLMAAQRSTAFIDAVEMDQEAISQCQENFSQSLWSDRLNAIHSSIQSYAAESYDTIICNPPFFENSLKAPDQQRSQARHTDSLSFEELARDIKRLMIPEGKAWLLLPVIESESFLRQAKHHNLKLSRCISIRTSPARAAHRNILVLDLVSEECQEEEIFLFKEGQQYSELSYQFLQPYYLAL